MSRLLFAGYFVTLIVAMNSGAFPYATLTYPWLIYLGAIYLIAEKGYQFFKGRNIDLTYAFPLIFAMYALNATTELLGGQDRLPLLNRTEHFVSHIFLAYVVWTFFTKYLPSKVWKQHTLYTAGLVFAVTAALGVLNEITELLLDALFSTGLIGNRLDTPLDLLMNTLGASLFLAVRLILGTAQSTANPQESQQHS